MQAMSTRDTITVGTVHDVVLGSSGPFDYEAAAYEGNKRFRRMMDQLPAGEVSSSHLLTQWKCLDPPGRFLKDDGQWLVEVEDKEALRRIDGMRRHYFSSNVLVPISEAWKPVETALRLMSSTANVAVERTDKDIRMEKERGDLCAFAIAERLKNNSIVTALDLWGTYIGQKGVASLCEALNHNSTLASLDLSSSSIDDAGASEIGIVLRYNSGLVSLLLRFNSIGHAGASAIAEGLKFNSTLSILNLHDNKIGDVGAAAIAEALKINSGLKQLFLDYCEIGQLGATAIAEAITHSSRASMPVSASTGMCCAGPPDTLHRTLVLSELDMRFNRIGAAGMLAFAECLKRNSTLTQLHLSNSDICAHGIASLAEALKCNSNLTILNLVSIRLRDEGAAAIADALEHNSTLTKIDLRGCKIGNAGAVAIGEALKHHTVLQYLDISGNLFDSVGKAALTEALKHNCTITTLHLCWLGLYDAANHKALLEHNALLSTIGRCLQKPLEENLIPWGIQGVNQQIGFRKSIGAQCGMTVANANFIFRILRRD
jgi:Ran GTPase-activating protein (RanGAP) involved in mRNA processing and transport